MRTCYIQACLAYVKIAFPITVKGENGIYRLAIWQRGGYSYSLSLEKGADAATFLKIAEENQ